MERSEVGDTSQTMETSEEMKTSKTRDTIETRGDHVAWHQNRVRGRGDIF